jgi:hypothetical protein
MAEMDRMRLLLMRPATSGTITFDQVVTAVKQRQLQGQFNVTDAESTEVLGFARRRWPNDPEVGVLYREWIATLTRQTVADLSSRVGTPWDVAFIGPIIQMMEEAAEPFGLGLLDRYYASWSNDVSIPPRLSSVLLKSSVFARAGFYNKVEALKQTHDRATIAWLRPFLEDKTIDEFTSKSSNMPYGATPMRYCDLAANGILVLLGAPEMVSPWARAKAPATGVPPEWDDWDRKIVALRQRLDSTPNRQ